MAANEKARQFNPGRGYQPYFANCGSFYPPFCASARKLPIIGALLEPGLVRLCCSQSMGECTRRLLVGKSEQSGGKQAGAQARAWLLRRISRSKGDLRSVCGTSALPDGTSDLGVRIRFFGSVFAEIVRGTKWLVMGKASSPPLAVYIKWIRRAVSMR